jgi:hypothetical protein
VPTQRNHPARDCYQRHGFHLKKDAPDGAQLWDLDLLQSGVAVPSWIEVLPERVAVG